MNVKKLWLGLLTATLVITPFTTFNASATERITNSTVTPIDGQTEMLLMAKGKKTDQKKEHTSQGADQNKKQPAITRRNSTGHVQPTISKDSLGHRTKTVINNPNKKLPTQIDVRKQMQYKQDGQKFKNQEKKLNENHKYTEHTVPPRTGSNRGAERIVKDDKGNQFHTKDHYNTFKKVTDLKRRNSH